MGEISDALARAKKTRKTSENSSSRSAASPADRRVAADEPNDKAKRVPDGPGAGNSPETPVKVSARRESDKPGMDARVRAEILSKPKPVLASSKAPAAAPSSPVIHPVPRDQDEFWIQRLCAVDPNAPIAVRFRHFGARVRAVLDQLTRCSVLVTSGFPGEGKTTVSINLALAIASIAPDSRVALVDLDLRRGTVGDVMGYKKSRGIESALAGKMTLDEARVQSDINRLDFYPIGNAISAAHEVLGGGAVRLLEELHNQYDYVICDGPPVLPVPDVPLIAPHVGGCLAVVGSGKTRHKTFTQLTNLVPRGSLIGVFLNECPAATTSGDSYQYYGRADAEKVAE